MPTRLATLDIGTNTAQLLVVEKTGRELRRVGDAERFVRLGEGVDAAGRIGSNAQERLLTALHQHVEAARAWGAERVVAAGTSALRDAANRTAVCRRIRQDLGVTVDILSGDEEATWSFAAACSPFGDLDGDAVVVDVGGGSTELIAGHEPAAADPTAAIRHRVSLDVGCIRLTERCLDGQPPSTAAVTEAERVIDAALASAGRPPAPDATLIGTAGTATALALVDAGPDSTAGLLRGENDPATPTRIPTRNPIRSGRTGGVLSRRTVRRWRDQLLQQPVDAIRALHPNAMDGRADVFPVGVMLLDRVMAHVGADRLHVSPRELRYGLAMRAVRHPSSEAESRASGSAFGSASGSGARPPEAAAGPQEEQ